MTDKENKTTKDVDKLFSNINSLLDLFSELKTKVSKIENILEGKPSEGISSLFNDVKELKIKTHEIEEKLNKDILENINSIKYDIKDYEKINSELTIINQKLINLELYKESKQSIEKFLAYIVPFISVGLAIIVQLLMPVFKR